MKFLVMAASLLAAARAEIDGILLPETVRPGGIIPIIFAVDNTTAVQEVAFAVGYRSGGSVAGQLGLLLGEESIGPEKSNTQGDWEAIISLPGNLPLGTVGISVAVFRLDGAGSAPSVKTFSGNVQVVGDD